MSSAVKLMCSWPSRRVVALALLAVGLQACSGDVTRFGDNPFGPREPQAEADVTGSVSSAPTASGNRVEARPLSRTSQAASTPAPYSTASAAASPPVEAGGGRGMPPPDAPPHPPAALTTYDPAPTPVAYQSAAVAPAPELTGAVHKAQPLHLPAPNPSAASTAATAPGASGAGHLTAPANSEVHVVAAGDTLSKIARRYRKTVAELAKANSMQPGAKLNPGDHIIIPGVRVGKAKAGAEEGAATAAKPAAKEVAAFASPSAEAPKAPKADGAAVAADATPSFRWPVRGRIIAAFGAKPNGQQNDGIDVAVPENTPIKAAEDGVVAYAGSELKGYGNLVLVRHPSGYVTAYAHAKELLVKKGDPVKRGQVIAKSGQSGNVEAPELHFEVRKGTAPIDPMQFLKGA